MKPKASPIQLKCSFVNLAFYSLAPLSVFLATPAARAQEGLSDAIANEAADKAQVEQASSSQYTYKNGDFRMLLTPAMSLQWNDNINCTETGKQDDFIILPTLGVTMSYPLTDRNLLQLSVTAGYNEYINHHNLSSWYLSTGSGLSFDMYVKDIIINLHDNFSYSQNSAQNPAVAGTGSYGTFDNSIGVSANWRMKYVSLTAGFDHQNTLATSSEFDSNDNATEEAYTRAGYNWDSALTTGVEGTASYTDYQQDVLNNVTSYTAGVYGSWHPDTAISIVPRLGYSINQYAQSAQLQTSDLDGWYCDLNWSHQITRAIKYSIDLGHNINPGVQSSADETTFANLSLNWHFIRSFSFQPQFSFQHGVQGAGSTVIGAGVTNPVLLPSGGETYNWYSATIGFGYDITSRFTASVNYTFTDRTSSLPNRGYVQNVIGLQIAYHPI